MACTSLPRYLVTSALFVLAGIGVPVASAAVQNRISAEVANSNEVAIPDSVQPRVRSASDQGPTAADTRLGMSIRFNMSAAQGAALDQLLADQQNPSSPRYHQWLTPAQFAAQFGLSSTDIAKVSTWLTSRGFTVTGVGNGGTFVTFSGTVGQAETAFGTSIHNLSAKGETHFANVTDVQVPNALAGVVAAVTGLHDFRFKPRVRASLVKPNFTSSVSGSHFIAPGDIYTIYNVNTLAASANGTGQTIAVVGQVDIFPADVAAFRSASGLSTTNLPVTIHAFNNDPGSACTLTNQAACYPQPSESDLAESSIDVEWAGAMAPSATIDFVNAPIVLPGPACITASTAPCTDAMTYAIDNNLAPIIGTSYGNCEAAWGTTTLNAANALFKQANAQGQTILAAAGDGGATDCDAGPTAIEGETVDFPGSSPYVTSMGGTQFNEGNALNATTYWSGTNGTTGGSATQYIPEAVWNDVTSASAFGGGGGGTSAYFAKPAWQVGTPADSSRDVPDISLDASDSHDSFLYCVNVAASGNCTNGYRTASSNLTIAGGTSFDSQIMAGLLALIEQKLNTRLGNINPTLYALGNSSTYAPLVFNDVTTGNNSMPCSSGTPFCGNGGVAGFNAVTGFDLATGWGSVNVSNLATNWTKVTPLSGGSLGTNISVTALTITPNCPISGAQCLTTVAQGATVALTATVTGSAGTPTGNVQFLANNIAVTTPVTLTSGGATYSWVTSCSNLGQNVMSAVYSGDANYQGSKGPILSVGEAGNTGGTGHSTNGSVIVAPVEVQITSSTCPDFAISTTTPTQTVAAGGVIPSITITATPANGFTGTVTFSATATSTSGYSPTLTFSPASVPITGATAVTTTLALTGITADLRIPTAPGKFDPGITVAQGDPGKAAARESWYAAGSGVTIASMLLLILPRRRRRLGGLLLVALAVALIGGATGCGGNSATVSSGGTGNTNPYVGTYTVTVVGTFTSSAGRATEHVTTVTYVIN